MCLASLRPICWQTRVPGSARRVHVVALGLANKGSDEAFFFWMEAILRVMSIHMFVECVVERFSEALKAHQGGCVVQPNSSSVSSMITSTCEAVGFCSGAGFAPDSEPESKILSQ